MSDALPPVGIDELLAHRAWVRALARSLARDEHEAADAEQTAWAAALRSPPAARTSLRGWLAVTTRNAVAKLRRAERRRAAHETASLPRRDVVDAAALAEQAEAHRRVVEALLRLPEPQRAALLLRYFQGLRVTEAAAALGISERAFRDRVRTGLERLRADLEPRFGGRAALGAALLAFEDSGRTGGVAAAGGVVVGTLAKTTAAAAAVLVVAAIAWRMAATSPAEGPAPATASRAATAAERVPAPPRQRVADGEDPMEQAPVVTVPPIAEETPRATPADAASKLADTKFTVELHDSTLVRTLAELTQAADVPIWVPKAIAAGEGPRITLTLEDVQGSAALTMLGRLGACDVRVESDRVLVLRPGLAESDLVLVPRLDAMPRVEGVVVVHDAEGRTVAGASIRRLHGGAVVATTGPDGRATIRDVEPLPRVFARFEGREDSGNAELRADRETVLRLGGPTARLTVRVTDRAGRPAAGAAIRVVPATTGFGPRFPDEEFRTGADGSFVHASCPGRDVRVTVRHAGHATTSSVVSARPGSDETVAFALLPESVVEGIVRSADGTPVAKVAVNAMRGTERAGRAVTDAEGRFRIAGLAAGVLVVGAKRTRTEFAETNVDLAEGETLTIELTLPPSPR